MNKAGRSFAIATPLAQGVQKPAHFKQKSRHAGPGSTCREECS